MKATTLTLPPARARRARHEVRLLAIDRRTGAATRHGRIADLPELLEPGDALVLNDAATWPASLFGRCGDAPVELRLAARRGDTWRAVVFGDGDWRTPTEHRPPPPQLVPGDTIRVGEDLSALVLEAEGRLVTLRLDGSIHALYAYGHPVQYAHADRARRLEDVQTAYATRPYAFEMPSAGWGITPDVLHACRRREIAVLTLTHEAGLSSTGDAALDARLPFPERYEIPRATIDGLRGRRVIAVGTSVVRALEGAYARFGELVEGEHETDLVVTSRHELRVVDGLLTGLHVPGESHYELLRAFLPEPLATLAVQTAIASAAYLAHELGDAMLVTTTR